MSSKIDFESLLLLTNVKSESDMQTILDKHIDVESLPISVPKWSVMQVRQLLTSDNDSDVIQMIINLSKLCYTSLRATDLTTDSVNKLFPQTFDNQLKQTLIKLIIKNSDHWLKQSKPIQPMPSLTDFECRTESNNCVLDLDISDRKEKVSVILNKQQIQEMIKGMSVVRQQLFDATLKSNSNSN